MRRFGAQLWMAVGLTALAACGEDAQRDSQATTATTAAAPAPAAPRPPSPQELDAARATAQAHADSVERGLRSVRFLTRSERSELRRDVNREQIAAARRMGVRAGSEERIQRLVREGRLVALEDSTPFWVVEKLEQSVPYVTPDAHAMLQEIGRRFHERLDSLGLPRFRYQVTSVLRTAEGQEDLRRINANASQTVSAHEFGTTLDVSHLRFSAPADPVPQPRPGAAQTGGVPVLGMYAEALDSTAVRNAGALRAVLGRVLREMKREGKLLVMMERQQAVYHMTVARRMRDSRAR